MTVLAFKEFTRERRGAFHALSPLLSRALSKARVEMAGDSGRIILHSLGLHLDDFAYVILRRMQGNPDKAQALEIETLTAREAVRGALDSEIGKGIIGAVRMPDAESEAIFDELVTPRKIWETAAYKLILKQADRCISEIARTAELGSRIINILPGTALQVLGSLITLTPEYMIVEISRTDPKKAGDFMRCLEGRVIRLDATTGPYILGKTGSDPGIFLRTESRDIGNLRYLGGRTVDLPSLLRGMAAAGKKIGIVTVGTGDYGDRHIRVPETGLIMSVHGAVFYDPAREKTVYIGLP